MAAAVAAKLNAGAVLPTSPLIRALRDVPVMASPPTVTIQTPGNGMASATSTITGAWLTPEWKASTAYIAGQILLAPDGKTLIQRVSAGTSGANYDTSEQAQWTTAPAGSQANFPVRYNANLLRRQLLNGTDNFVFGPRAPKRTDGTEDDGSKFQPQQWSIDFDLYGDAFEIAAYGDAQVRFIVDGQYVSATPTQGSNDYKYKWIKVAFASVAYRRIRVEIGSKWPYIGGIKVATGQGAVRPSLPRTKRLAVIADSFGEGYIGSGIIDQRGFLGLLGRMLGFSDVVSNSVASTGFSFGGGGSVYADRIPDLVAAAPDYLYIHGSTNDFGNVAATFPAAALSFYQAIAAALPNTKIVAGGAFSIYVPSNGDAVTAVLKAARAHRRGRVHRHDRRHRGHPVCALLRRQHAPHGRGTQVHRRSAGCGAGPVVGTCRCDRARRVPARRHPRRDRHRRLRHPALTPLCVTCGDSVTTGEEHDARHHPRSEAPGEARSLRDPRRRLLALAGRHLALPHTVRVRRASRRSPHGHGA